LVPVSGSFGAWPFGAAGFSAASTCAAVLPVTAGASARSLAAATTPSRNGAIEETSLPAKSAIARVLPSFGSWRNTRARSLVPNHTAPSEVTATAVTRLSSVSNTSRAAPPLTANSLPDGPVPA
jgi:hypothetical protein